MQQEIDYVKIGQRIKTARIEKKMSQAELGYQLGCSNNHVSHVETAQTKVSLSMLLKIAYILEKDVDFFLFDTPYVNKSKIIDDEIVAKLKKCNPTTLVTLNSILDALLIQQEKLSTK